MNAPAVPSAATAPAAPTIGTRAQLDALLDNIAELHRERDALWQAQEAELAAVRQRYRAPLTDLERMLQAETGWAEAWAREHRAELGPGGALERGHATLGFRSQPPRLERASRRWTWSRIALTLAALPWGRRYLRIPEPVVDQDAIVADLGKLSPEDLRAAGMTVVAGEQFFLEPRAASADATAENAPWREAA